MDKEIYFFMEILLISVLLRSQGICIRMKDGKWRWKLLPKNFGFLNYYEREEF